MNKLILNVAIVLMCTNVFGQEKESKSIVTKYAAPKTKMSTGGKLLATGGAMTLFGNLMLITTLKDINSSNYPQSYKNRLEVKRTITYFSYGFMALGGTLTLFGGVKVARSIPFKNGNKDLSLGYQNNGLGLSLNL
jgi:hypothetical protein